jgi:hypothetical protein
MPLAALPEQRGVGIDVDIGEAFATAFTGQSVHILDGQLP